MLAHRVEGTQSLFLRLCSEHLTILLTCRVDRHLTVIGVIEHSRIFQNIDTFLTCHSLRSVALSRLVVTRHSGGHMVKS